MCGENVRRCTVVIYRVITSFVLYLDTVIRDAGRTTAREFIHRAPLIYELLAPDKSATNWIHFARDSHELDFGGI
jgi:hypothetical protein